VNSERVSPAQAGFSLIEVLIAMVILAVGLLAVEALGIGAARSVQRARVQSAYSALATDELERTMAAITQSPTGTLADKDSTVGSGSGALSGARLRRIATADSLSGTSMTSAGGRQLRLWNVKVSVTPPTTSTVIARSDSVHLESNVIR
jgi:type IV pilus modification protein PilV